MDPILERYQALEDKIKEYNPALDAQRLFRAFTYADNAHAGQLRKDGSPYITHPLAVAEIVAELELDTDSIIAALLHDCIEDTGATHEEIAKLFGATVADLVEGVTKLTRVQYTSKEEEQMENLRKMLMAMAKDIRVILIKICDRLHNMRTMEYQSARKQKEKALETMEIYAPIAHRLGMQRIKWELEDTSLQYLDPIGYREIADELAARSSAHEEFLAGIQKRIQDRLDEEGIRCTIYGRVKHIYSIYRKMYTQNKTMDEIFDLYAFRVIVDDMPECYNVLGVIHDLFNPVLGRFKDYISTPKPNGYQSLHTTVIGREGIPFEVQIRTKEMHEIAEDGVAAHMKPGSVFIDMSSINPVASKEIAAELAKRGIEMLDAPVSGGEPKAIDGTLSFMVGGKQEVFDQYKDILGAMGTSVVRCGDVGAGNTTKLANQIIVACNIQALSEALTLAKMAGVDPELVFQAIRGGLAGSTVMNAKAPMMIEGNDKPGFKIDLHIKDLNNALDCAHTVGSPLPMTAAVQEIFQWLHNNGCGQHDHRSIIKCYQHLTGIESL